MTEAPSAASEVDFSFDWRPERARAGGGIMAVSLRDGDNVIMEFVNIGNWSNTNTSELAYRVGTGVGSNLVTLSSTTGTYSVIDTTKTNFYGGPNGNASLAIWYTVAGKLNFGNGTAEFTIKNNSTGTISSIFSVDIADNFANLNTLYLGWEKHGNNQAGEYVGIDNFNVSYTELSLNDIASITQPQTVPETTRVKIIYVNYMRYLFECSVE